MPSKAPTICRKPGCRGLVRSGVCSVCGPIPSRDDHDERRGTSAQRGYGYSWQQQRERFLIAHRYCAHCLERQTITPATDVHHIVPRRDGGSDDDSNLLALCHSCHSRLTAAGG